MTRSVVKQDWEESERGWGTRSDGYSLHLTIQDLHEFIKDYWNKMPNRAPDTYSRPYRSSYIVDVDDVVYQKVKSSKNGMRY